MNIDFLKDIIKQVVCWILLLQVVNMSINPPDLKPRTYTSGSNQEDLSINEIESVCELVAEAVFGKDISASNEDDSDTYSPSFELYYFTGVFNELPATKFPLKHFPHYKRNFPLVHQEPLFQPPKVA